VGTIERYSGAHVFPDSNAHGKGEDPRPLYTVRFTAQTLWGEAANPRDSVCLDLWEPYLERA
jgi:nitrile hydratase